MRITSGEKQQCENTLKKNGDIMIYVGIDTAEITHSANVEADGDNVLVKPIAFDNKAEGFAILRKKPSSIGKDNLLIALESVGIYSESITCFLYEFGFKLAVINAIQTVALRKTDVRKTKTAKLDT